jgi:hypothetical protein
MAYKPICSDSIQVYNNDEIFFNGRGSLFEVIRKRNKIKVVFSDNFGFKEVRRFPADSLVVVNNIITYSPDVNSYRIGDKLIHD